MPGTLDRYLNEAARLLDPRRRELEPVRADLGISRAQVRDIDTEKRQIEAVVSTASVDRYEEIVLPSAFQRHLGTFMDNPVFVAAHDYSAWANAEPTVLGQWRSMEVQGTGDKAALVGVCEFDDVDPLALRYWNLYRKGHMRAFSVGWLTHQYEMRDLARADGSSARTRVFTEVELIEVSAVAIPANRDAVVRQLGLAPLALGAAGRSSEGDPTASAEITRQLDKLTEQIKQLHSPDGPMVPLIQDVVEATLAAGPGSDDAGAGKGTGDIEALDDEGLAEALRGMVSSPAPSS